MNSAQSLRHIFRYIKLQIKMILATDGFYARIMRYSTKINFHIYDPELDLVLSLFFYLPVDETSWSNRTSCELKLKTSCKPCSLVCTTNIPPVSTQKKKFQLSKPNHWSILVIIIVNFKMLYFFLNIIYVTLCSDA